MNSFIYDIPTKVYFGENQLGHLGEELSRYGKKVLLTYGGGSIKKSGLYDKVVAEIKKAGLELFELSGIEPNPKVSSVRPVRSFAKKKASRCFWRWAADPLSTAQSSSGQRLSMMGMHGIFWKKKQRLPGASRFSTS